MYRLSDSREAGQGMSRRARPVSNNRKECGDGGPCSDLMLLNSHMVASSPTAAPPIYPAHSHINK